MLDFAAMAGCADTGLIGVRATCCRAIALLRIVSREGERPYSFADAKLERPLFSVRKCGSNELLHSVRQTVHARLNILNIVRFPGSA